MVLAESKGRVICVRQVYSKEHWTCWRAVSVGKIVPKEVKTAATEGVCDVVPFTRDVAELHRYVVFFADEKESAK